MFKILQNRQILLTALNFYPKGIILFLFFSLFLTLSFWLSLPSVAQESDALAIRIYANPNGYSAVRWYNNEFSEEDSRRGAPQSIADVDGYEAVKDGRTVYVNAGNLNNGTYYANIYTLGFSQEPDSSTMKVHTNMLKHWTMNTNLIEPDDYGACSIPTRVCLSDSDCFGGYVCHVDDGSPNGDFPENLPADISAEYEANYYDNKCHLPFTKEETTTCWRDKDCKSEQTGLYCSGKKAEVTRRTKRLANLADIKSMVADFLAKDEDNTLPDLAAGSYIPGVTLSTWNSWNETNGSLADLIQGGELPVDPINTMGACAGSFNPETCWDDVARAFGGSFSNGILTSPVNGSVYGYSAIAQSIYSFSADGTIICHLLDGSDCH